MRERVLVPCKQLVAPQTLPPWLDMNRWLPYFWLSGFRKYHLKNNLNTMNFSVGLHLNVTVHPKSLDLFFFVDTRTFLETCTSECISLKNVHTNRCLIDVLRALTLQQEEIHTGTEELADFPALVRLWIRKKISLLWKTSKTTSDILILSLYPQKNVASLYSK